MYNKLIISNLFVNYILNSAIFSVSLMHQDIQIYRSFQDYKLLFLTIQTNKFNNE